MCCATCPETSVLLVLVKTGQHCELAGLEAPHPWILPGQLPEPTHSISYYGADLGHPEVSCSTRRLRN